MALLSLRNKLLVGMLAVTLLFTLGLVLFAETVLRTRLERLLEEKGVAIARKVAADCVNPAITERWFEIEMQFKDLQANEADLVYLFLLGEDGRELVHTFATGVPAALVTANIVPPHRPFATQHLATDRGLVLDIGVPLLRGAAGVLHMGLSEQPIRDDVNQVVLLIVVLAGLALGAGVAISFAFARYLTGPLTALTAAAEAFGRGATNEPVVVESADEIGTLARVFNLMVENRQRTAKEREALIGNLQQALNEVKVLRGILPICASCKKIRTDEGSWQQIEQYIRDHSDVDFTHGICPDCVEKLYPELALKLRGRKG